MCFLWVALYCDEPQRPLGPLRRGSYLRPQAWAVLRYRGQSPSSFFKASRALFSRDRSSAGGTNSRRTISKYSQ